MNHISCISVTGTENGIDFDASYRVSGWRGIAFYLLGWSVNETINEYDEVEESPDHDNVVAVMVGDDRRRIVSISDLKPLDRSEYCGSCGQIGCCCS